MIESFKQFPSQKLSIKNFHEQMEEIKQPFQQNINKSMKNFSKMIVEHKTLHKKKNTSIFEENSLLGDYQPEFTDESSSVQVEPIEAKPTNQRKENHTQESDIEFVGQDYLREWKNDKNVHFNNFEDIADTYTKVFTKKQVPKKKQSKNVQDDYDFKNDQKEMLLKIFNEIKKEENFVSFDEVAQFFEKCNLFYLYYNIRPEYLLDLLKDSSRVKKNFLSRKEFLTIFYIDRPNLLHFNASSTLQIHRKCILEEEDWRDLKNIFDTLDTFGNQTIHIKPFYQKIKNNYANRNLINSSAISFPQIQRVYTLKKVIFDLQNKQKLSGKVRWKDIYESITNFSHMEEPTIDVLYQKMLEQGKINHRSNYFLISQEVIKILKDIFQRSPKYCDYFVKTKYICTELLDSPECKSLKKNIVRTEMVKGKCIETTFEDQIRILANQAHGFIDLDELLEYFSIKGPISSEPEHTYETNESSSDEEIEKRITLKNEKSLQNLKPIQKQKPRKPKIINHLTVVEQFNLSKKQKQTIRDKKVKEMKTEKQKQDEIQMKLQFRAHPIPAQLNPERYKQYLKKIEQKKHFEKQQAKKKRQKDEQKLNYLKANSKIFEKKKINAVSLEKNPVQKFIAKPVPWFATENMLERINQQKILRKKQIYTETKMKILKEWKKLPEAIKCVDFDDQMSDSLIENLVDNLEGNNIKIKEIPNFSQLHRQFQQELARKKQIFQPTVVQEFHFSSPKVKKRSPENPELLKRVKSQDFLSKHKKSVQTVSTPPEIPLTKKYESMVNQTLNRIYAREEKEKEEKSFEKNKKKDNNFAQIMKAKFQKSLHLSESMHISSKSKIKSLMKQGKALKMKNHRELGEIYARVMNRPFLFELNSNILRKNITELSDFQQKGSLKKLSKQFIKKQAETLHISNQRKQNQRYNLQNNEEEEEDEINNNRSF